MYTIFINNDIVICLDKVDVFWILTLCIIHCNKCGHGLHLVGIFYCGFAVLFSVICWHWGNGMFAPVLVNSLRLNDAYIRRQTNHPSDNGLSPGRRQAIIWTNAGILLIGPLGSNFSEILIGIQTFSSTKMHLKMSSAKWRPFCLSLNVLNSPKWYR